MTIALVDPITLHYSTPNLRSLTELFEGCELKAYQDQGGVWTIGYGHTGADVTAGRTITLETAEALLVKDVMVAEVAVKRFVKVGLSQEMFDSLVDFVFNVGAGNFQKSTLLKLLNAKQYEAADQQFSRWDKVAGKVSSGLHRRRLAEAELFEHGVLEMAA